MDQMTERRADALIYRAMEARELQRELEHLQAKIDAIKLEAMDKLYHFTK